MKIYVADWSVNKNTYEEFLCFIADNGYDVNISGYKVFATKGNKKLYMSKGFKCSKNMLAMTKRFARER